MSKDYLYDIIGLGECLVDVVVDPPGKDSVHFEGRAGGAPVNVLACVSKLGLKTGFIGMLSNDALGKYLMKTLVDAGVCVRHAAVTSKYPTTLAIVSLDEKGDRSFSFYRNNTSDVMLDKEDVDFSAIDKSRIFHFGSVSMTAEPSRSATLAAAAYAKKAGCLVSYDPNLRPSLWSSMEEAYRVIHRGLEYADLVKVSEEELFFLTNAGTLEQGVEKLLGQYSFKLLALTLGPKGCSVYTKSKHFHSNTYDVKVVDTTGAGDTFWGAFLYKILSINKEISSLTDDEIVDIIHFSNAAGALTTTARGAIPALPSKYDIEYCIKNVPLCS